MKNLVLDSNYTVECDAHNFTLKYESKSFDEAKQKEITSKNEWHFPRLSNALDKYMNECLRPTSRVEEVLSELKRVEALIKEIK